MTFVAYSLIWACVVGKLYIVILVLTKRKVNDFWNLDCIFKSANISYNHYYRS